MSVKKKQNPLNADPPANQAVEPSMKDIPEAMKVMGYQVVAMIHMVTPLASSSVCEETPVATAIPLENGQAGEPAKVIEIDPPARTTMMVNYIPFGHQIFLS